MKNYLSAIMLAACISLTLAACDKDDDDDNKNEIVEKKGIAMTGDQEVPAKTTNATGTADVSYNKTTKILSFTLYWTDLSDVPTGSHIHGPAARGENAGVKFDFFSAIPKTVTGTYSSTATVDEVNIKEDSLLKGFYYFNIHTANNPGGEIRGQIEF